MSGKEGCGEEKAGNQGALYRLSQKNEGGRPQNRSVIMRKMSSTNRVIDPLSHIPGIMVSHW
jgi:hypothetical protein